MKNDKIKKLARDLLRADAEEEVVGILKKADLWEDSRYWRMLGDDENNFKTVGAQQARPEPALVEKLVNAVDARLTAACYRSGLDPVDPDAPQSIVEACERFFGGVARTELANEITMAVTGARKGDDGMPCITICDTGEGQSPRNVPETFMSIDRKNKLRINFVQGKFNMGGTGALMFCGRRKLQLLITRRDPEIVKLEGSVNSLDSQWSVTVVRRETPPEGPGQVRNPYFKYLAPVGATEHTGGGDVLTFSAEALDLMPIDNRAYARPMSWGSCIKLYDYDMRGFKGHVLRKGGLLPRLEVLLPEVALPVRVHECRRGFKGHAGSFDTNLIGLRARLEGGEALEPGCPWPLVLNVQGEPMIARIYAFKGKNADSYRAGQGIVFTINGQTHGWFPKTFFERKRVKMARLADALLVVVDCTRISVDARADLFKNSRDRLSGGDLRRDIEEELESQIAHHQGLRDLRDRRRREEVTEKLSEAKPLEDVIKAIMKTSPALSKLFLQGQRLNSPFHEGDEGTKSGGGRGAGDGTEDFKGRPHPTYFRFEKLKDGEPLSTTREHARRCRLKLVTDVENDYFLRDDNPGRYHVEVLEGPLEGRELTTNPNPFNGVVNWSVAIPEEDVKPGDSLTIQFTVDDDVIQEPFVNIARILLTDKADRNGGRGGRRRERSRGTEEGGAGVGSNEGQKGEGKEGPPSGIELPPIDKVHREGWKDKGFDDYSVCTIIEESDDDERSAYHFYVNVDNICLLTDVKQGKGDPALTEAKFVYGSVLVGLALIHDQKRAEAQRRANENSDEDEEESIKSRIEQVTRALGPFLVPMIDYLGRLEEEEVTQLAQVGDEE